MEIIQWKYTCLSVVYLCKHFKAVLMILLFSFPYQEQLNIMLFELAQRLHNALSKVDISFYTTVKDGQSQSQGSCAPLCNHMHPAKLVMVKKEGQNKVLFIPCLFTLLRWKCWSIAFSFLLASFSAHGLFFFPSLPLQGRLFYACDAPKAEQCSFFKWMEDVNPTQTKSRPSAVLHDTKSIGTYLRSQKIAVYEECQLLVRYPETLCTSLKVLCEFRAYKYSSSSGFQQDLSRFHYIWKDFFL